MKKYHFCWTCMGKFGGGLSGGPDGYSTHTCNGTYEEDQETKDKKAELERYKHYSERYDAHSRSALLENKMLINEDKILGNLKNEGFLGNDFSPAVHQILQVGSFFPPFTIPIILLLPLFSFPLLPSFRCSLPISPSLGLPFPFPFLRSCLFHPSIPFLYSTMRYWWRMLM